MTIKTCLTQVEQNSLRMEKICIFKAVKLWQSILRHTLYVLLQQGTLPQSSGISRDEVFADLLLHPLSPIFVVERNLLYILYHNTKGRSLVEFKLKIDWSQLLLFPTENFMIAFHKVSMF